MLYEYLPKGEAAEIYVTNRELLDFDNQIKDTYETKEHANEVELNLWDAINGIEHPEGTSDSSNPTVDGLDKLPLIVGESLADYALGVYAGQRRSLVNMTAKLDYLEEHKIDTITVNGGNKIYPDLAGNVDIQVTATTDDHFDVTSENPLLNKVVTSALNEITSTVSSAIQLVKLNGTSLQKTIGTYGYEVNIPTASQVQLNNNNLVTSGAVYDAIRNNNQLNEDALIEFFDNGTTLNRLEYALGGDKTYNQTDNSDEIMSAIADYGNKVNNGVEGYTPILNRLNNIESALGGKQTILFEGINFKTVGGESLFMTAGSPANVPVVMRVNNVAPDGNGNVNLPASGMTPATTSAIGGIRIADTETISASNIKSNDGTEYHGVCLNDNNIAFVKVTGTSKIDIGQYNYLLTPDGKPFYLTGSNEAVWADSDGVLRLSNGAGAYTRDGATINHSYGDNPPAAQYCIAGQLFYDRVNDKLKVYKPGPGWVDVNTSAIVNRASSSTIGGIKVGYVRTNPITINQISTDEDKYYRIECDGDGNAFVNVPWVDTHLVTAILAAGEIGTRTPDSNGVISIPNHVYSLSDVLFGSGSLTNNDILSYDSTSTKWTNKSVGDIFNAGIAATQFPTKSFITTGIKIGLSQTSPYTPSYNVITLPDLGASLAINGRSLSLKDTHGQSLSTVTLPSESPQGSAQYLNDLDDVTISSGASSGEVLKFNGTSWVNGTISTGGGASYLNDLTDVTLSSPSGGQVLKYRATDGKWINSTLSYALSDLSNVNLTQPYTGDILKYDGSDWVNSSNGLGDLSGVTITTGSAGEVLKRGALGWTNDELNLGELGNVSISSPSTGEVLKYNGSGWVNGTVSTGGGASDLNDLTDVTVASLSDGLVLKYSSTNSKWQNSTVELGDLSNVSLSPGGTGQVLMHNGTNWTNETLSLNSLSGVSVSSLQTGDVLKYNGSGWVNGSATYSLPVATTSALGGVKVYNKVSTTPTILTRSTTSGRTYGVECDSDGLLFVNVPWTDTTSSSVSNIDDLTDVSFSTLADGEVLRYNSSYNTWENDNILDTELNESSSNGLTNRRIAQYLMPLYELVCGTTASSSGITAITNQVTAARNGASSVGSSSLYQEVQTLKSNKLSSSDLKTINGTSIVGSGDITITSSGTYTLPAATNNALGGIKVGYTTSTSNKNYAVQIDSNSNAFVNVPWTDTVNSVSDLDDLSDVTISGVGSGQALIYDGASNKWKNQNISLALANLSNVSITAVQNGDVLKYNSTTQKWENGFDNSVTVDSALNTSSTNAILNKVVTEAINSIVTFASDFDSNRQTYPAAAYEGRFLLSTGGNIRGLLAAHDGYWYSCDTGSVV